MEKERTETLSFELSPSQMKYKSLLNKDFLQLEIWAISDIDPNRNDSHFTLEAMEDALPTFKNKPIIGLFEKGDFGSHDGVYRKDIETGIDWWDTEHGERILGVIRESDNVEIVEKDNLHWIKFTCVLFVKYCYKQVKRLLKDKTKRVSVEITTHKVYERDDGVRDILSFTLNGVTVLGTKNGRPVIEGIPGAHLSVIEQMDESFMESQKKVLCFAYDQYDQASDNKSIKEDDRVEEIVKTPEVANTENFEENKDLSQNSSETFDTTEGNVPPVTEEGDCGAEQNSEFAEEGKVPEGELEGEHNAECECTSENEPVAEPTQEQNAEQGIDTDENGECEKQETEAVVDEKQKQFEELQCKYDQLCINYESLQAQFEQIRFENQEYAEKISNFETEMKRFEDYETIKSSLEEAQCKLAEIAEKEKKQKMFNFAMSIMANETIVDEDKNEIIMKVNDLKYSSEEEIEKDVAYACYKARIKKPEGGRVEFSAPISTSYVDQNVKKPMTREERLAQAEKMVKK